MIWSVGTRTVVGAELPGARVSWRCMSDGPPAEDGPGSAPPRLSWGAPGAPYITCTSSAYKAALGADEVPSPSGDEPGHLVARRTG